MGGLGHGLSIGLAGDIDTDRQSIDFLGNGIGLLFRKVGIHYLGAAGSKSTREGLTQSNSSSRNHDNTSVKLSHHVLLSMDCP